MKKHKLPLSSCSGDYSLIKAALACCYSANVAYRPAGTSVYVWLALDGVNVDYGEESAIAAPVPQIVICHRVIQCRNYVMKVVGSMANTNCAVGVIKYLFPWIFANF